MLNESLHLWTKSDRIKYFLHSTTRRGKKREGRRSGAEQSGAKQSRAERSREEEEKQPEQINERMELETNEYVL